MKLSGEAGSVLIQLFMAAPDCSGLSLKSPSPLSKGLSEAELFGNSGPCSGCEEDLSLLKVAATACGV